MNDDQDWKQLQDTWKTNSAISKGTASGAKAVKTASRMAAWRLWLGSLAICSTIAVITLWWMLHRSVQGYTFMVIAWSAFFSLGSYVLSTRESASDLALETTTALEKRSKSLAKTAQSLDFGRTLIAVECFICIGFWIALHLNELGSALITAAAIAFGGSFLYLMFSRSLAKTRLELRGLDSIAADLRKE
jgi:Na+/melibiose symporter-like transporter